MSCSGSNKTSFPTKQSLGDDDVAGGLSSIPDRHHISSEIS